MTDLQRDGRITEATLVDLIQRAQQSSDPLAWDALYVLCADRLFRFLLAQTGDVGLAEELTSQVFLRLMERIGQYRIAAESNVAIFSAWLYRIARNRMIDVMRAGQRSKEVEIEKAAQVPAEPRPIQEVDMRLDFDVIVQRMNRSERRPAARPCLALFGRDEHHGDSADHSKK